MVEREREKRKERSVQLASLDVAPQSVGMNEMNGGSGETRLLKVLGSAAVMTGGVKQLGNIHGSLNFSFVLPWRDRFSALRGR